MLRMYNRYKRDIGPGEGEETKTSESELAPYVTRVGSSRHLSMNSTFERRINKILRWGDWIFVASADCSFCVWGKQYLGFSH